MESVPFNNNNNIPNSNNISVNVVPPLPNQNNAPQIVIPNNPIIQPPVQINIPSSVVVGPVIQPNNLNINSQPNNAYKPEITPSDEQSYSNFNYDIKENYNYPHE